MTPTYKGWWRSTFTDPQNGELSHIRQINFIGALTASIIMITLLCMGQMSEGYFAIYIGAVGLTAVGYRAASRGEHIKNET